MEALATSAYKLKVRLGQNEFDAEGPEDSVKEQYALFLEHLAAEPRAVKPKASVTNTDRDVDSNKDATPDDDGIDAGDLERLWNRAYKRAEDQVSLHVLPQGKTQNPDSILLLLYGFQILLEQKSVKATDLSEACKQSGVRVDRLDRAIPREYGAYLIKGGSGKGTRYSLNNRGLARSQELLEQLFD